jgi:hypothetical protein
MEVHGPNIREGILGYCRGPSHESEEERIMLPEQFNSDARLCMACQLCDVPKIQKKKVEAPIGKRPKLANRKCQRCGKLGIHVVCDGDCRNWYNNQKNNRSRKRAKFVLTVTN